MGERTSYEPGTFSWVDLSTNDPESAKTFYSQLFGWDAEDVPVPGGTYTMFRLRGRDVAAVSDLQEVERAAGVPPHWNSYVTVVDVDATAARVSELGGSVTAPPFDVMDAGRMAVIQDPTGGHLSLWQPGRNHGAGIVNDPGSLTWNELGTPDPQRAGEFFEELLGWTVEHTPEYSTIKVAGRTNGGLRPETDAPPAWLPYFTVESIESTTAAAQDGGGRVLLEDFAFEAGRFAVLTDPQNAPFAIFEGDTDPDP